jgi:hypothetical protein
MKNLGIKPLPLMKANLNGNSFLECPGLWMGEKRRYRVDFKTGHIKLYT